MNPSKWQPHDLLTDTSVPKMATSAPEGAAEDSNEAHDTFTAFAGHRLLAQGTLAEVLSRARRLLDRDPQAALLFFRDQDGTQVDFDLRGTIADVLARTRPAPARTGPGRPKLGVVSREVSLLPRHWEWLESQPSGISAALRRLVERESRQRPGRAQAQRARDATSRFLTAMAGNLTNYEEATRALFRGECARFVKLVARWPAGIRKHAAWLSTAWFESVETERTRDEG